MAMKLMVPPPVVIAKMQPEEIALDANDLVDEDHTEPSGPPVLPGILIGPTPPPPPPRLVALSLPSQYEIDSERKSSPPIAERRKTLTKYVASAVGVAWFICTCAIGETALRSIIASMH
jgi:hypothetical protein